MSNKISTSTQATEKYIKSLEDEIDWTAIDQLHNSTLRFSSNSFEIKKMLVTLIGITSSVIIALTNNLLDISMFIVIYTLIIAFWFLDSFTYYYQEKLRSKMDTKFNDIRARNKLVPAKETTISNVRTEKWRKFRAMFNHSMWLYYILLILNTLALICFKTRIIG